MSTPTGPEWRDLLKHWRLVEADLHEVFGVDVEDRTLMQSRSWRWLRVRIESLIDTPDTYSFDGMTGLMFRSPTNRIRTALFPPSVIEPAKGGA